MVNLVETAGRACPSALRTVFTVTSDTKVVDGVTTRVIFDRLFLDNKLAERTFDYYAQDDDGNVWYFGEDTVKLDALGNLTDTEGSFRAGVDGALVRITRC